MLTAATSQFMQPRQHAPADPHRRCCAAAPQHSPVLLAASRRIARRPAAPPRRQAGPGEPDTARLSHRTLAELGGRPRRAVQVCVATPRRRRPPSSRTRCAARTWPTSCRGGGRRSSSARPSTRCRRCGARSRRPASRSRWRATSCRCRTNPASARCSRCCAARCWRTGSAETAVELLTRSAERHPRPAPACGCARQAGRCAGAGPSPQPARDRGSRWRRRLDPAPPRGGNGSSTAGKRWQGRALGGLGRLPAWPMRAAGRARPGRRPRPGRGARALRVGRGSPTTCRPAARSCSSTAWRVQEIRRRRWPSRRCAEDADAGC